MVNNVNVTLKLNNFLRGAVMLRWLISYTFSNSKRTLKPSKAKKYLCAPTKDVKK